MVGPKLSPGKDGDPRNGDDQRFPVRARSRAVCSRRSPSLERTSPRMPIAELTFESGETSLSVRSFRVEEAVSTLFSVRCWPARRSRSISSPSWAGPPPSRSRWRRRPVQPHPAVAGRLPLRRAGAGRAGVHCRASPRLAHEVRPGAYTIRDHDFRRPSYPLAGQADPVAGLEARYEQYHYRPGGFRVEGADGFDTPRRSLRAAARPAGARR